MCVCVKFHHEEKVKIFKKLLNFFTNKEVTCTFQSPGRVPRVGDDPVRCSVVHSPPQDLYCMSAKKRATCVVINSCKVEIIDY